MRRAFGYVSAAILLFFPILLSATFPAVATNTWTAAQPLSVARSGAATVMLQDGRLLITGGSSGTSAVASVDIVDTAGNVTAGPPMNVARAQHTATLLQDGRVLVAGGTDVSGNPIGTAEIFDPSINAAQANPWTTTGPLVQARSGQTATLLNDGTVLIAGGTSGGRVLNTLELFNPASSTNGSFTVLAATLSVPRARHAAVLLEDGRVLIVGGWDGTMDAPQPPATAGTPHPLATTDIYDASAQQVRAGPALNAARMSLTATTQLDGQVFLAGGNNGSQDLASVETFDPTLSAQPATFTPSSLSLTTPRSNHLAILLPHNGGTLLVGGSSNGTAIASAELYMPVYLSQTETATLTPVSKAMSAARVYATGSPLSDATVSSVNDGLLLIAGGIDASGNTLSSTEIFGFPWVKTDALEYAPGTPVNITGGGFQPGETVTLHFQETPYYDSHPDLTAVVQGDGTFSNSQFAPDAHDLDIGFFLTATGSASGRQAQTVFADSTQVKSATIAIQDAGCTTNTSVFQQAQTVCANVTVTTTNGNGGGSFYINWYDPSANLVRQTTETVPSTTPGSFKDTLATTGSSPTGTWTVKVCNNQSCSSGNVVTSGTFALQRPQIGSVSVGAQSQTPSYGTAGSAQYTVTVYRASGTNNTFTADLSSAMLPAGVTGSFNPSSLSFAAVDASHTATLTLNTTAMAAAQANTSFAVTAVNSAFLNDTQSGDGLLTITKVQLTITAKNASKTYGQSLTFAGTEFSTSGLVNSDAVNSVTLTSSGAAATATVVSPGPTYAITPSNASGTGLSNYNIQYVNGTLTVTAAPLTITAKDASKTYGQSVTFSGTEFSASGLVNGDTVSSVTLTSPGTAGTAAVSGSPYAITPSGALGTALGNYTISYVNGSLTVGKAALTITAKDASKTYGQTLTFAGTEFTATGLVNSDTVSSVTLASPGAAVTATLGGSPYAITPSAAQGTGLGNYTINYVNGTLTLGKAPLAITAKDASKTYGQTLTFAGTEFTASGLVNSDTVSSVTLASPGAAVTATVGGSPYAITPGAAMGTGLGNYTISYVNGSLTVSPAALTLAVSGSGGVYNGSAYLAFCSVSNGLVNGDSVNLSLSYSPGTPVNVGQYTATCTSSGNSNYQTTTGEGMIVITPAPLTITADSQTMTFGGATPNFTASYTGLQGSDTSAVVSGLVFTTYTDGTRSTPVTNFQTVAAGSYPIVPSGATAANYSIVYANGTLTVNKATFKGSVTISPADPATVAYGQPATATVYLDAYSIGGVDILQAHNDPNDPNNPNPLPPSLTVYLVPVGGAPSEAIKFGAGTAMPTYDNTTNTTGTNKTGWAVSVTGNAPPPGNYNAVVYGDDPGDQSLSDLKLADAGYFWTDTSDIQYPTLTSNRLDVVPAALTITANDQTKSYGQAFTFKGTEFSAKGLVGNDSVTSVTLTSAGAAQSAGVAGSPYDIVPSAAQGFSLSNYTIQYVNGHLKVMPVALTVTADAQTKVYGQADPTLTYRVSGLQLSDTAAGVLTGALARAAGESVAGGPYAISQGTLAANSNYTITFTGSTLTITPATLTITADPKTRMYGDPDPTLTYQVSGLQFSDTTAAVLTGTLTRAQGENVGPYAISQGTLAANPNYTVSFTGNTLTITPAPLTVTVSPQTKMYGDSDPMLTYVAGGFKFSDTAASVLTGSLGRTAGESVAGGPYAISQGSLVSNSNYTISFTGSALTITPAPLTVTANTQSKVYGEADPALTYSVGGFKSGDVAGSVLTGSLARTPGDTVAGSPYAISQGSLAANTNYTINFTGSTLTIKPATLTVTAEAKTKVYGQPDPALTYTVGGLELNDTTGSVLVGSLTRVSGETVAGSPYAISQGTLSANSNYTISFTGSMLIITPATLTITANSTSKTYGQAVAFAGTEFRANGLVTGDSVTSVTLTSTGAAAAATVQGSPYDIVPSNPVGIGLSNYTISYVNGKLTVTAAVLAVTADPQTKVYGQPDPVLSYKVSGLQGSDTAAAVLSGSLSRNPGENVAGSPYAILQGSLTSNPNYTITYSSNSLTITAAALMVTANPQTKVYGQPDPALTYSVTGLQFTDTAASVLSGSLSRAAGENVGSYLISQATLAANSNYTVNFVGSTFTITQAKPTAVTISNLPAAPILGGSFMPNIGVTSTPSGDPGTTSVVSNTPSTCTVSGGTVSFLAVGTCSLTPSVAATTNYTAFTGQAQTFIIGYGFLGLQAPYAPPPATFNVQRTMPVVWQYTNANGAVVNSATANPQVQIFSCGTIPDTSTQDITVDSAGTSGYQYNSATSTWQFNWQVKASNLQAGCYDIYIVSGQTGQMSKAFPIYITTH